MALSVAMLLLFLAQNINVANCEMQYIGNAIVDREFSYTTFGVPYGTFLLDRKLPKGTLNNVELYSHHKLRDARERRDTGQSRCLWLQLFQRTNPPYEHQLKWNYELCLDDLYDVPYALSMRSPVEVLDDYYFGWTCGRMFCPVSYDNSAALNDTLFGMYYNTDPYVGSFITLDQRQQHEWALGVWIDATEPALTTEENMQSSVPWDNTTNGERDGEMEGLTTSETDLNTDELKSTTPNLENPNPDSTSKLPSESTTTNLSSESTTNLPGHHEPVLMPEISPEEIYINPQKLLYCVIGAFVAVAMFGFLLFFVYRIKMAHVEQQYQPPAIHFPSDPSGTGVHSLEEPTLHYPQKPNNDLEPLIDAEAAGEKRDFKTFSVVPHKVQE